MRDKEPSAYERHRDALARWGSKTPFRFWVAMAAIYGSLLAFCGGWAAAIAVLMGVVHV